MPLILNTAVREIVTATHAMQPYEAHHLTRERFRGWRRAWGCEGVIPTRWNSSLCSRFHRIRSTWYASKIAESSC